MTCATGELILRDRDQDNDAAHTLEQRLWVLQDGQGNVSSLLDGGGTVAGRFVHGPHGEVEQRDASWGTTGPTVAFDYPRGTQRYDRRTHRRHPTRRTHRDVRRDPSHEGRPRHVRQETFVRWRTLPPGTPTRTAMRSPQECPLSGSRAPQVQNPTAQARRRRLSSA